MKKLRKLLALSIAICMVCTVSTTAWAEKEEGTDAGNIHYVSYDLSSGERREINKTPENASTNMAPDFGSGPSPTMPYTIFDPSSWTRVSSGTNAFPYRAIAYIEMYWYDSNGARLDFQTGTGFAIAPGKVLTAAHCLYNLGRNKPNLKGLPPDKIIVKFGKNNTSYYKQTTSTTFYVNAEWEYYLDADYDYGVISVPTSITSETGHFGRQTNPNYSTTYTLSGYPYDNKLYKGEYLYTAGGKLDSINSNTLEYLMNATGGVSGAPLYTSDYYAVGIHTWSNEYTNTATRITDDVSSFINGI